jgi:positive regulator of sigma E activity
MRAPGLFPYMQLHWRALVALFGLILTGFLVGLAFDSITIALWSLMSGFVVAFVLATAFLRAEGHSPEHHARVDSMFGDMNP